MAITIDISAGPTGTWTVEDDGTLGNNTSVVRRPDGTIFTTFVHPADAVTIVSKAGQSINVNIIDSLTTANFTIGSLTVPASNPDSIQIGGVLTSGVVTLAARNAITEFGSDASSDIIAGKVFLDAGSGIGAGNAIETQTGVLEAESVNGGIFLSNIGNVVLGGVSGTADLRGLFTGTSGNVVLINQGGILLSDTDGIESVRSAGSLTLSAIGATADISSDVNRDALLAVGNIFLNAGRDVKFGTVGVNFDNDVRSGANIFINAGRDFHIDGFSDMASDDQGLGTNGGITITAGRDILIEDDFGVDASVGVSAVASTGAVILTTGVGGTLSLAANSSAAIQGRNGGVTIRADRMLIESDSGINVSGSGVATLTTASAGRGILLGSATDGVADLELSDVELDRVVAPNLTIGGTEAGTLNVVGQLTHNNNNLTLRTGSDVFVNASITTVQTLILSAAESISQGAGSTLTTGTLTATVDTPDNDPAGGTLNFGGGITAATVLLTGNADSDTINGTFFADTISGLGGDDILRGFQGADILNGGTGADLMVGGTQDDFYFTDNVGDRAVEVAGEGTGDRVFSAANFILETGSEVEILSTNDNLDVAAINLTGNALSQFIFGNAGANSLDSGGGGDTMLGFGGDYFYFVRATSDRAVEGAGEGTSDRVLAAVSYALEAGSQIEILSTIDNLATTAINLTGNSLSQFLFGNAGANTLDGAGGGDTMMGFGGDDFFFVRSVSDRSVEAAGEGNDRVFSAVSYVLEVGSSIEMLTPFDFTSTNAIDFQGNALSQSIFGNAGNNSLDGGGGADVLVGLAGDDFYFIRNSGDRAVETSGNGNDRVFTAVNFALEAGSHVEMLTTIDNLATTAINITGNELGNSIFGNAGVNVLDGKGGNDTLVGLQGADIFAFSTTPGAGNVDSVSGFEVGVDKIALEDSVYTGVAPGALPPGAFRTGTTALDSDDRVLYDSGTGALFYDADGSGVGAAVQFATVAPGLGLSAGDFIGI